MNRQPSQCDRVLAVLEDGLPHTIEEIHERAGTMRLNSRVAELRKRGHEIVCTREGDTYSYCLSLRDAEVRPTGAVRASASQSESGNEVQVSAEAPSPDSLASDECGRGATPGDSSFLGRHATGTVLGDHSSSVGDQGLPPRRANERERARLVTGAPQQLSIFEAAA